MDGIQYANIQNIECNYNKTSNLAEGSCMFDGHLRKSMVVYELKLQMTGSHVSEKMNLL